MRVCETGKLSQTEGSLSVKEERVKRDSAGLAKKGRCIMGTKSFIC